MEAAQGWTTQPYYQIQQQLPGDNGAGCREGLLTAGIAPTLRTVFKLLNGGEAVDAGGRVAVAMTRYRLDQGGLPSKLTDLVPKYLDAIPADPFDGHSLRLAIKGNQWIIYSIGADGVDNGGAPTINGRGDFPFTLALKP
jgi:hypothetical protein